MKSILLMAAVYGTLIGGDFAQAPDVVKCGNAWRVTRFLDEPRANALGYALLIDEPTPCSSNQCAVATGYDFDSATSGMRIRRIYDIRTVEPQPRKFSKLKIYWAVASLGKWAEVKAWLEANTIGGVNGWTAFQLAQEVSEDHALFATLAEEARQLLGLTETQFEALLNSCLLEG